MSVVQAYLQPALVGAALVLGGLWAKGEYELRHLKSGHMEELANLEKEITTTNLRIAKMKDSLLKSFTERVENSKSVLSKRTLTWDETLSILKEVLSKQ